MTEDAEVQVQEVGTDQAVWSGHASIYRTGDGGLMLAYRRDGETETYQHHVPGMLVAMAQRMSASGEVGFFSLLKGMMGRGGD